MTNEQLSVLLDHLGNQISRESYSLHAFLLSKSVTADEASQALQQLNWLVQAMRYNAEILGKGR